MSRPALSRTLPLVVVMAALTLTSRPQHADEIAVGRGDRRVDVDVAIGVQRQRGRRAAAVQATASLTKMSPLPGCRRRRC